MSKVQEHQSSLRTSSDTSGSAGKTTFHHTISIQVTFAMTFSFELWRQIRLHFIMNFHLLFPTMYNMRLNISLRIQNILSLEILKVNMHIEYTCWEMSINRIIKPISCIDLLASNNIIEDGWNYHRYITVQALWNLEIKFFIAYWF